MLKPAVVYRKSLRFCMLSPTQVEWTRNEFRKKFIHVPSVLPCLESEPSIEFDFGRAEIHFRVIKAFASVSETPLKTKN